MKIWIAQRLTGKEVHYRGKYLKSRSPTHQSLVAQVWWKLLRSGPVMTFDALHDLSLIYISSPVWAFPCHFHSLNSSYNDQFSCRCMFSMPMGKYKCIAASWNTQVCEAQQSNLGWRRFCICQPDVKSCRWMSVSRK